MACGILVPQPGIEPGPMAVEVLSPNHWIARECPKNLKNLLFCIIAKRLTLLLPLLLIKIRSSVQKGVRKRASSPCRWGVNWASFGKAA